MAEEVVFEPVSRLPRLSDAIAEKLLQAILAGRFGEGDALPSERDLGAQFGVSRTVVREAIRSLATRGVVDVQSGRGVRVLRLGAGPVSEAISLFLRGTDNMSFSSVHEVRTMLETQIAEVAAERADETDLANLHEVLELMTRVGDDVDAASLLDVEFHRAIARATHNELYAVLLESIAAVLLDARRATLSIPHRPERVVEDHHRVLDAIGRHDPDAARRAMEHHLANVEEAWRTQFPDGRSIVFSPAESHA